MSIALELNQMTLEEKIRIMETLWDDLCRHAEGVTSPLWHKDILSRREKDVTEGLEQFKDWDTEKERIRKAVE